MFDEYLEPPQAERPSSPAQAVQAPVTSAGTPLSTTIDQDAPSLHISPSSSALQSHSLPPGVVAEPHVMEDHNVAPVDNNPFVNVFAPEPHSKASSSGDITCKSWVTEANGSGNSVRHGINMKRDSIAVLDDKMADVNAPSGQTPTMAPPVRADDQMLLHIRWVPIGKSNCYLDLEKSQSNPIYKIAVGLLKNTNFFRAFTASSTIPSLYIQQFWDT
nr:hypothetical protein [Tanacetum cinerariifolium]